MPVDLSIDTDGKTENKRIEVVGTNSPFTIETFGRPRRIAVDPDHHVLTNSSDVKLRASILRGQAMQQQGDLSGALTEFNKALDIEQEQFAGALPNRRGLLHPAELSVVRQRLS